MPLSTSAAAVTDLSVLKNIALVIFFVVFLGVALRLVLTRRSVWEKAAQIPLSDDDPVEPRRPRGDDPQEHANHG